MNLRELISEADTQCKDGEYFCRTSDMCKPIPDGYHVMPDGELMKDGDPHEDLDEAVRSIWGKSGNKQVRKYRCTSGQRKGRIVAKAATCNAPINQTAKLTMKKTKRKKGSRIKIATAKTKRTSAVSRRLGSANTRPKRRFAKGRSKKI